MARAVISTLALLVLAAGLAGWYWTGKPAPAGWLSWFGESRSPEEALARDPGNPYRWCELGESLADRGQAERAGQCMRRAAELGPKVPAVLMRAANYWMGAGDQDEALPLMSRVLALTEAYDGVIFSYYRRLGFGLDAVMEHGLPNRPRPWREYFRGLLPWAEPAATARVWAALREREWNTDKLAGDYAGYLVDRERLHQALAVWSQQLGARSGEFPGRNRVYNGSFERELSGTALDWWVRPVEGAAIERVREGRDGGWALKIEFDGSRNVVFRHVAARAVVDPGWWQWVVWLRTEGVTTDQGVYLHVSGAGIDQRSEKWNGTNDWTELSRRFHTRGAGPAIVRLLLARDESLKIDNKVWGTVWLTGAAVRPIGR